MNNGIGFGGVLFVVFLVMKLAGFIEWSWWWVTAPLWLPVVLALLVTVGYVVFKQATQRQ
jgi:hypothetical protein